MARTGSITTTEQAQDRQKLSVKSKASKLTPKETIFVETFVETKNATKSALEAYDTTDRNVASQIGSENLAKPRIRDAIVKLLGDNDIELKEIFSVHKRNLLQDKHLPTSQKAVSDFYEILGLKNQDSPSSSTKVAFFIVDKES